MAIEAPLDTALCQVAIDDAVQTLGDRVRDVSSYLEEHPEDFASCLLYTSDAADE